jgi:hypothetical protein
VFTNSNATQIMSNKPLNFVTNSNATKNKGFVNLMNELNKWNIYVGDQDQFQYSSQQRLSSAKHAKRTWAMQIQHLDLRTIVGDQL